MKVKKALEVIHEYWPDTKNLMWGEALETVCSKAEYNLEVLKILRAMVETGSNTAALHLIDSMINSW